MGLETGTYVSDLVTANPPTTDSKQQGDDHIRLLKSVLQATFPNASKVFRFPETASKTADFSVASTDMNKTFMVDTTAGSVVMTLPTLASADAGTYQLVHVSAQQFRRAWQLRQQYHDKPDISFVDFTSIVVMQDLGIQDIFTGDAHFQQVNLGFRLVP